MISNTKAISASWLTRSPNRLITWPTHSAENEPLSASRMYGCCRIPSSREGRATGTPTSIGATPTASRAIAWLDELVAGAAMPTPRPPSMRGRWRTDASSRPGERPVPAWSAASETVSPGGNSDHVGSTAIGTAAVASAGAPATGASRTAVGAPPDGIAAPAPVDRAALAWSIASRDSLGTVRTVENRKNDRPAVRNRSPIDATLLSGGMGSGIRSASGPEAEQELGAERRGQRDVEHRVPSGPPRPAAWYAGSQTGM